MTRTIDTLTKATVVHVGTGESVQVLWNPARYRIQRRNFLSAARVMGRASPEAIQLGGGTERFETELFVDTTEAAPGAARDARAMVQRVACWMEPEPGSTCPPQVAFVWGPFRFVGLIEVLEEEWVRFDPDGTPVRAWVYLNLRR